MHLSLRIMMAGALLGAGLGGAARGQTGPNGALPGNDVGTASSLPLSPHASNIEPGDTPTPISPRAPVPNLAANASVADLLAAASREIKSGRTGTAESALEQAETNILDRSVTHTDTDYASQDPMVRMIDQSRMALGAGDSAKADAIIARMSASNAPELQD